jgi:hypothetical protein
MHAPAPALALGALLAAGCAAAPSVPSAEGARTTGDAAPAAAAAPDAGARAPGGEPGQEHFLAPNAKDADGMPAYVHVEPEHMPWVVAIALPPTSPQDASRERARDAAIEEMRRWEQAIQPLLAWFRLEFVEEDAAAPVQVIWKRRLGGDWGGWGGVSYAVVDGKLLVGGQMQLSLTPSPFVQLKLDDLRLIVAHEFGHVLGLGHCLECDSAMNYASETAERTFVTPLDVRTFLALVATPNGQRTDGQLLRALRPAPAAAASEPR